MFTASLDILSNLPWQASACWQEPGPPGLTPPHGIHSAHASGLLFVGCGSASCLSLPASSDRLVAFPCLLGEELPCERSAPLLWQINRLTRCDGYV